MNALKPRPTPVDSDNIAYIHKNKNELFMNQHLLLFGYVIAVNFEITSKIVLFSEFQCEYVFNFFYFLCKSIPKSFLVEFCFQIV